MTVEATQMLLTTISDLRSDVKSKKAHWEAEHRSSLTPVFVHLCQRSLQREQILLEFTTFV